MQQPTTRSSGRRAIAATLGAAALMLVGCSQSSTPHVATAEQHSTKPAGPAASSSAATQTAEQKYIASERAFAKCSRAAGVNIPDPDAKGKINYPPKTQAMIAKLMACGKLLVSEPDADLYPDLTPAEFAFQKRLAVCMRAHGVPAYPDPLKSTKPLPSSDHAADAFLKLASTPVYQKALNTCSVLLTGHEDQG